MNFEPDTIVTICWTCAIMAISVAIIDGYLGRERDR